MKTSSPIAAPSTIIVLAREHIGDLVCTTPALRSLRRLYPGAHIAVEVGERAACVLANSPHVDEIILRRDHQGLSGKIGFIHLLRRRRFDLGVILDNSPDMILYLWLGGVTRRVGLVRKPRFAHLLTDPIPFDRTIHETIDNFRNVVEYLGGDVSNATPVVFPTPVDCASAERMLRDTGIRDGKRIVALVPGTSVGPKCWPIESFLQLASLLNRRHDVQILVVGGPSDRVRVSALVERLLPQPAVLTGMTMMELAEVVRRCAVLVTGDTGTGHLACATGTPVVSLFGPTMPHIGGPCYVQGNILIRKVTGCPDCTWKTCVHNNRCMQMITAEEVAEAVRRQLDRGVVPVNAQGVLTASA